MKEYKIVSGTFTDYIERQINDAAKDRFEFEQIATTGGFTVVVMSRPVPMNLAELGRLKALAKE